MIKIGICKRANSIQRGFITGRQFTNNIVDLDTTSRTFSNTEPVSNIPVMCTFDFAAAFPSVIHSWILRILNASRFPEGFCNLVGGIYHLCRSSVRVGNVVSHLCHIDSGVLQGCPLSGSLFVIASDPFLNMMTATIEAKNRGIIRACADDIGAVLRKLSHLCFLAPIFSCAQRVAGLTLKPNKCFLVPLHSSCSLHATSVARDALVKHVPLWRNFFISFCAKYLGVYLGPNAKDMQWHEQHDKWCERSSKIASLGASFFESCSLYNTRSITTLSYVAQVFPAPSFLLRREVPLLNKIFKLPGQAWRRSDYCNSSQVGGPNVTSLVSFATLAGSGVLSKPARTGLFRSSSLSSPQSRCFP